jgi:sterol 24-C-methyltransferase
MPSIAEAAPTDDQIRDKEFAKALHGSKATESAGYLAILKKNSEAQKQATSTYFQFWDKAAKQDTDEDVKVRSEKYTDLVNAYYNLATDLYEYGWAESFHFCRFYKGEGFHQVIIHLL